MMTEYGTGSSMRAPPRVTNSASTPTSRRRISSMKAGGNDHSRPTRRPILVIGGTGLERIATCDLRPATYDLRPTTWEGVVARSSQLAVVLVMPTDVRGDHVVPVGPIM